MTADHVALAIMAIVMLLWDNVWRNRIIDTDAKTDEIAAKVSLLRVQVALLMTPEFLAQRIEILKLETQLHEQILACRRQGNLELANRLMEYQHWNTCDYDAHWLDGFRGLR